MARILCLETATTNCSVALCEGGALRALREDNNKGYSHAELLHVFIDEVLRQSGLTIRDLDAVAVSKGPGSYTGLRIGVSAAKGLCFAANLKLIAVSTMELLAQSLSEPDGLVVPMLDARRMEVYTAVFSAGGEVLEPTRAEVLNRTSFKDQLDLGPVHFVGNGAQKFAEICEHPNARFYPEVFPSAREMPAIAQLKYKTGDVEDVAYFEPFYLKDFILG